MKCFLWRKIWPWRTPLSPSEAGRGAGGEGLVLLVLLFLLCHPAHAQLYLFDATKTEMAGNADWVVDADAHNLNVTNGNGSGTIGTGGTDSNPQRVPTVGGSMSTAPTKESDWTGGISNWGTSLVDRTPTGGAGPLAGPWQSTTVGANSYYPVETLPYNGKITYGSANNAQDLSHYKVFVLDEPNILFTTDEATAINNFVYNGGSLFIIADHAGSDRNNDGNDSRTVWNSLFSSSNQPAAWGISFNNDSVTATSTGNLIDQSASDPITNGGFSTSAASASGGFAYDVGATIKIDPTANASVKAAAWYSTKSNANVMIAYGNYGAGRFVAVGDSSPFDDGTGDPGDTLFNGWGTGADSGIILNASAWLQGSAATPEPDSAALLLALGVPCGLVARARLRRSGATRSSRLR